MSLVRMRARKGRLWLEDVSGERVDASLFGGLLVEVDLLVVHHLCMLGRQRLWLVSEGGQLGLLHSHLVVGLHLERVRRLLKSRVLLCLESGHALWCLLLESSHLHLLLLLLRVLHLGKIVGHHLIVVVVVVKPGRGSGVLVRRIVHVDLIAKPLDVLHRHHFRRESCYLSR